MGPKKKQEKKKKKGPPSPKFRDWSSKFDILLSCGCVRFFKWEILNFSLVNTHCIYSDYFDLGAFRFRFLLFPKGQESRNTTGKHLSICLERVDNDSNRGSSFLRSKITIVNHEDNSSSVCNSIFHRFLWGSGSHGQVDQFVALDSLLDPERGFLLNGTDLHIRGDAVVLCENQLSRTMADSTASTASTSDGFGESSEGTYVGGFFWFIFNYSYFEEALMTGMLRSDPIKIGECFYFLRVCSQTEMDEEGENHLIISVELVLEEVKDVFHGEAYKSAWFTARFVLWSQNQDGEQSKAQMSGRISKKLLNIAKMSEIIIPEKDQCFGFLRNYLHVYFDFNALKEKDIFKQYLTNSKNIWNFGEGPKATSTGKKKLADKIFAHFSWEIKDFLWVEPWLWGPAIRKGEIWSTLITLGQNYFFMIIAPFGRDKLKDWIGAFLTFMDPTENKQSLLVHYRLNVQNQKGADENARKGGEIERFSMPGVLHGHSLLPTSTFNTDSSGYIVEGSAKFDAYIHVLEETYDIREVHELGKFSVKWKVDNFLAWEAIRGYHLVPCKYFELDGCLLRMEVGVSTSGTVIGTLTSEPSLVMAGVIYKLIVFIAVINQKNPTGTDWKQLEYYTNETKTCNIGYLSDILKGGAGFVVNDKIIFCCQISLWKQEDTWITSSTTTSSS